MDGGKVAVEVKGTNKIKSEDMKGSLSFVEDYKPQKTFIVCQEPVPRKLTSEIEIIPWKNFLEMLWNGDVL